MCLSVPTRAGTSVHVNALHGTPLFIVKCAALHLHIYTPAHLHAHMHTLRHTFDVPVHHGWDGIACLCGYPHGTLVIRHKIPFQCWLDKYVSAWFVHAEYACGMYRVTTCNGNRAWLTARCIYAYRHMHSGIHIQEWGYAQWVLEIT